MIKGKLIICLIFLNVVLAMFSLSYAKVPDLVLKQKDAVVTIYIYEKDKLAANGSGFIIDPTGIVATNYHVIEYLFKNPDSKIAVKLQNGEYVKAIKMLSLDKANDVALIKVDGNELPSLKLSENYKPKQGDDVFVIGSPFGLETTISDGIISSIRGKDEFLQITAAISPGSSGSPVLNSSGEVIGIATLLIEGGQNLNFAIPSKYVEKTKKAVETAKEEILNPTIPILEIKPKAEIKTQSAELHIKRAEEFYNKEQWNEAIEEYSKAIALKSGDANLFYYRGTSYIMLGQELAKAEEHGKRDSAYNHAIEDYSRAIALTPDDLTLYNVRARVYVLKKEWAKAIPDLNKAIALKSNDPKFYMTLGYAYGELGMYKESADAYKQAIDIEPESAATYIGLGVAYRKLGMHKEAIDAFRQAIRLKPNDDYSYLLLGLAYITAEMHKEAIEAFAQAIRIKPDFTEAHYYLGRSYGDLGMFKEAEEACKQAIRIKPDYAEAHLLLGALYSMSNRDMALEQYKILKELDPNKANELFKLINKSEPQKLSQTQVNQSLYDAVHSAEDGRGVIIELDKIEKALRDGADPNWINPENRRAISILGIFVMKVSFVSSNDHVKEQGLIAIKRLFAAGAKLQHCDNTILYFPIAQGDYKLAKLLLEKGASAISWDKDEIGTDKSPIQVAIANGHIDIANLLVEYGAKFPTKREAIQGLFIETAKEGSLDDLKLLIKEGAVINGHGFGKETALLNALDWAITDNNSYQKVMYLLAAKADVNQRGKGISENTTPLHQAIFYSSIVYKTNKDRSYSEKILRELLKRGAHVSAKDGDGETPLHAAAEYNHLFAARLLIEAGAKVMPKDNKGKTPLDYAQSGEMIKLLKKYGAKE